MTPHELREKTVALCRQDPVFFTKNFVHIEDKDAAELVQHGVTEPDIVISTYDASHAVVSLANRELGPWEGAAVRV